MITCHIVISWPKLLQLKVIFKLPLELRQAIGVALAHRAPLKSFVGLKNGGATCYMNSVFQQLFMQPSIRKMLLAVPESLGDQTDNVFYQMQVTLPVLQ